MKKRIICGLSCALLYLFASTAVFSQAFSRAEAEKLLKTAEESTAFYNIDFTGHYTVVQVKPGNGKYKTEATMYRRDSQSKWTILVNSPAADKGKGYLQVDGKIWFFDPADKRFTFTSAREKFQGTNANNSDFMPQKYYSSYSIESAEEVTLSKFKCILYNLKAKENDVDYPVVKLWVTKEDGLVRKKEDYSSSGQLLRTTGIPSYQAVEGKGKKYSIPVSMVILDNLRGKKIDGKVQYEQTQVTITNPVFKNVDDSVYSKPFLEMMSVQ
ncbi:MAG: outer membrane lipoprotein-sorting protein [Treponema sp.]|nr:outer membrane lipoprotein-sorting protein [Treponema sp.]